MRHLYKAAILATCARLLGVPAGALGCPIAARCKAASGATTACCCMNVFSAERQDAPDLGLPLLTAGHPLIYGPLLHAASPAVPEFHYRAPSARNYRTRLCTFLI